ncbi:hypothetical protein FACS1894109_15550 [Spirochaetia bacterium]|nr:hypothetical protein FACS1894109_15550 [Spirochaetia bacterium]
MKCFECNWQSWYPVEGEVYIKFCEKVHIRCSDAYPEKCPIVASELEQTQKKTAYHNRFRTGLDEYYEVCRKVGKSPSFTESMDYADKFAGAKPE